MATVPQVVVRDDDMTVLVGIIIGMVLGLTGAGGSVLAVPLLIMLLGLPVKQAIGLSLGAVAISAMSGGLTKLKSGDIQWLAAVIYAVIGSIVAPIGNWINRQADETFLIAGFSILVLVIASRMWLQASKQPRQASVVRAGSTDLENGNGLTSEGGKKTDSELQMDIPFVLGASAGAVLTGLLSGLFGVGGGFLIIPTLLFLTNIPIKQAIATSLIIISAISSSGFISFLLTGNEIDTAIFSLVAVGGVIGMGAGIFISKYLAGPILQKGFSVLMLLMVAITLTKQF